MEDGPYETLTIVPGPMIYMNVLDTTDKIVVWVTHVEKMRLSN